MTFWLAFRNFCRIYLPTKIYPSHTALTVHLHSLLGSPIAQYLSWKEPRFHQLIGLKIDEQDNEDLSGFFIRLNHPKVLSFILKALQ